MSSPETRLPDHVQSALDRFITSCQADFRIVAAFLGGSYARDEADSYSDLDLYVITRDEDFQDISHLRHEIVQWLGDPLFEEDFDIPNILFFILSDGTEGEIGFGREGLFFDIHSGPYKTLVDKNGILKGVVFAGRETHSNEQVEKLRRQVVWFWHDLSHFITAMGRGQLWWAAGQLEILRRCCINLVRLRNDFSDPDAGDEAYFKLDEAIPVEGLSALQRTFTSLEPETMLQSGRSIVRFYQDLARPLSQEVGISYPDALERLLLGRLEKLLL